MPRQTLLYNPPILAPDRGEIENGGWVEVVNLIPIGEGSWAPLSPLTERVVLTETDIRGTYVHAQDPGTAGWMIYYGGPTKIWEIDPNSWTETDRSGAVYTPSAVHGWLFTGFGANVFAAGGHSQLLQVRQNGAGNFGNAITHAEPVHLGGAATGNWPPKPRFVANFGDSVAIANIKGTGPAGRGLPSDIDQNLLWVSETDNGLRYGVEDDTNHQGKRTAYFYLDDDHGPITALFGGAEYGMVAKARAIYAAVYGGPFRVDFPLLSARYGCNEPHSGVWVDNDLYFWSTAGPAVMSRDGVQILGETLIQRSIFDNSWIGNTYPIKQDSSVRYMLWATAIPVPGVVSWWYRGDADWPIYGVHYQISNGRFSFSQHTNVLIGGSTYSGQLYGAMVHPFPEISRYSGTKDLLFLSRDDAGAVVLYESNAAGAVKWLHAPKMTSGVLPEPRGADGDPVRSLLVAARPRYVVGGGGPSGPAITVTVAGKRKPGAQWRLSQAATVEDEDGWYAFGQQTEQVFKRISMQFGGNDMANSQKLAEIDGIDLEFVMGGRP